MAALPDKPQNGSIDLHKPQAIAMHPTSQPDRQTDRLVVSRTHTNESNNVEPCNIQNSLFAVCLCVCLFVCLAGWTKRGGHWNLVVSYIYILCVYVDMFR